MVGVTDNVIHITLNINSVYRMTTGVTFFGMLIFHVLLSVLSYLHNKYKHDQLSVISIKV